MGVPLPTFCDSIVGTAGVSGQGILDKNSNLLVRRIGPQHPDRASLQQFIADIFLRNYGATVSHYCDTLVGCQDLEGKWVAALGISCAKNGPTFLEQYLDAPLEREIGARINACASRERIVEIGNLAARHTGAARALIIYMTRYLHQQGMSWVAFTATRGLLNSFTRLQINPVVLAAADPMRLSDEGRSWGSYYDTKPQVMFADIGNGYARLAK
ncbi:thermostable hemolysin [Oxalobacteraceae bacterium R-40]|uniref:Thermostable hemolysin n=1 Tax=Keguizhuia sedimenti TaxID=3064264 RepID=A0ABU1BP26_9BURK|nr:thermostable hemolysin [Oxalobacteraceae bacterium R-40]